MKNKRLIKIFFGVLLYVGQSHLILADDFISPRDEKNFIKFNPDGNKYQFAKDYLTGLTYLKTNAERSQEKRATIFDLKQDVDRVTVLRDDLIHDNVNLRVARNYMTKYTTQANNGLMLQVSDGFIHVCNDLIEKNDKEKKLLEGLYAAYQSNALEGFDFSSFRTQAESISAERKEIYRKLLEVSVLFNKVLISNHPNYKGKFDTLGVTQEQRYQLLKKLNIFEGEQYKGEVREGQSFLEGSISVIRGFLEDYAWNTLEG